MRLLDHLAYVSEEALRVSGPLPADGTYDDPESGVQAFLEECETWPTGKYNDQVDAAAGAFNRLIKPYLYLYDTT